MRRRGITVLVGVAVVVLLTALAWNVKVPYVALVPGPTYDTLGETPQHKDVIEVTGAPTPDGSGQLRFVTVQVMPELNLLTALTGWFNQDDAVVPRELIYPPDKTNAEIDQQNAQEFEASQSSAQTVALTKLGYPVRPGVVAVKDVAAGVPAEGVLKPGDIIETVDGAKVTTPEELQKAIRARPDGSTLSIAITRAGAHLTVSVKTTKGDDGNPRIGISITNQPHPFTLSIPVENVGGPSAGLMLALGIIDKIDPTDLTGGKIIAGTGTIDDSGTVGPIGGVPQKLVAAKRDGAAYFLTPATNCAEAKANAQPGLPLVKVSSLDEALSALGDIRAGRQPALC